MASILGIHHVTAITADAQKNVDFYTGVLGFCLVKLTVNFDDPTSYHLYYGDETGSPGSIMTFFLWPGGFEGRKGPPQVMTTAFAAPRNSVEHWRKRLGVTSQTRRFGDDVISFKDPDGLQLELIFSESSSEKLTRFHSVTIAEEGYEHTSKLLTETMGFHRVNEDGNRFRFAVGEGGASQIVDLLCVPDMRHGTGGSGTVHHVAWRTADDPQQLAWRETLTKRGSNVSPVMDRKYFHSIYFREPGGVLFEIATDAPGFAVDEAADQLGTELMLPSQYEQYRQELYKLLPAIRLPGGKTIGGAR